MQFSREQYHRFLTNQCSEEERLLITEFFTRHPELLDEWLQSEEWEQFYDDRRLPSAQADRMRGRFLQHIQQQQGKRVLLYRLRIAAAVLAVLSVSLLAIVLQRPGAQPITAIENYQPAATRSWQVISNNTDGDTIIQLNDRSTVTLFAHSSLRFKNVFDQHKRDLYLTGAAHFAVAKNKTKPFTVFAQEIVTTALGTKFTVRTRPGHNGVQVALQEGRVMVQAVNKQSGQPAQTVYLWPGDELVMNGRSHQFLKQASPVKQPINQPVKKNKPLPGGALSFNHTPLVKVLEQLQQQFSANIRFDPATLQEIFVTASFTEQDTLSGILDILCTLNNLQLQRTGDTFNISR